MGTPTANTFDAVNRLYNRPLWVITAAHAGQRAGLAATWVSPVSLDANQPLFLISLAVSHRTTELVEQSRGAVLHLLTTNQGEMAWRFGSASSRSADKFAGLSTTTGVSGAPVLNDALAWFDCRVLDQHSTGDRSFYWLSVACASPPTTGRTPLFEQAFFASLTAAQRETLQLNMTNDVNELQPLRAAWTAALSRSGLMGDR